jgi:lambda family phage portal protein
MFGFFKKLISPPRVTTYSVADLEPYRYSYQGGSKFPGGYGPTNFLIPDYWTLRARSAEVFETNLYARGIVRCLLSNEIHTGLHLEATPEDRVLGYPEDGLAEWSETTECRFAIWGKDPYLCDQNERLTFGALQQLARQEALVVGDVLVVLAQDQRTRLPRVRLVNGASVQSPLHTPSRGQNRIVHGVELDNQGRHAAYWIRQPDGTSKRLPAIGEKSGRRLAWLLYGTDRRMDEVRGKPLLSLVLQSLKEIDRYRDSIQRKALVLGMIAAAVEKTQNKPGSRPVTSGAVRRGTATSLEDSTEERRFKFAEIFPGMVLEELQVGETLKAVQSNGTTEAFGVFEEAILQGVAWGFRIPPESLRMSFSSNYSASQAATNEFKSVLDISRTTFGENFCEPIYNEWLVAEVLAGRVDAPGLIDAWRDHRQYDTLGAWLSSDWSGNVKPSVKLSDLANAYAQMIAEGLITRDRAARELTGTKFSKNVQKLARENEALAAANKPIAELQASGQPPPPEAKDLDDPELEEDAVDERKKKTGTERQAS